METTPDTVPVPSRTNRSRRRAVFLRWLMIVAIPVVMVLTLVAWFQRSLIYIPTRSPSLRGTSSIPTWDVTFRTIDGLELNGWLTPVDFAKRHQAATLTDREMAEWGRGGRTLVLIFPGNGGNRSMREELIAELNELNVDSLIFDYRGYGDNPGAPSEANLRRDARSVWTFATATLRVPPERIVLYGESLGGGVATSLASELCQEGIEPGGLIIEASFDSLVAAGGYHFPYLPVSLLLVDRFPSAQRMRQVTCPVVHLHGQQDVVVPVSLGKQLFEAVPAQSRRGIPKRFVLLPNSGHDDVYGPDRAAVIEALNKFFSDMGDSAML